MQSVKEDIQKERRAGTLDIVAFFQVAQFFTSYQCCNAQKDEVTLFDYSAFMFIRNWKFEISLTTLSQVVVPGSTPFSNGSGDPQS
jgi:hypothetical protein